MFLGNQSALSNTHSKEIFYIMYYVSLSGYYIIFKEAEP